MTLSPGTRLGPYEIVAPLGAGGMGEVYRARDTRLGRDVAIKVVRPGLTSDPDRLSRFEKEARAAAQLDNPNILVVHDVGTHEGSPFIVSELLQGESLREKLGIPLPTKKAVEYAIQIARGLAAAHERGIVHRDIKPENVFVTKDGHVKILDFGVAKLLPSFEASGVDTETPTASVTQAGTAVGTVAYMSPEQIRGQPVDARTDLFSLGVVLYEMLSGKRPFQCDTAADTMSAILREEPPALTGAGQSIPLVLDKTVRHCLEKDRENRFQSARDIAFDLSEQSSPTVTSGSRLAAPLTGKRKILIAAVAIVVLGVASVVLLRRTHRGGGEAGGIKRVAVLPFENLGLPEDDYFADGIADEIRGKLTSLSGVEVIARASSTPYKKTTKMPEQIAQELDVKYLLTATVRWQKQTGASRVHVTPELVEVRGSGAAASKWQQPFDAALTDVFQVQSDIASRVAQALGVALGAGEEKRLAEKPTQNLAAYDAFLKGQETWTTGVNDSPSLRKALGFYEQAVALDPGFAQAWAQVSRAHSDLYFMSTPAPELAERARQAAEKAVALAPNRPEGYVALGEYELWVSLDFNRALKQFAKGQRVAPGNAGLLSGMASAEEALGRWEAAVEHFRQAQHLDPRSGSSLSDLGDALLRLRRYSEARETLDRALALAPANLFSVERKAEMFLAQGDLAGARAVLKAAPKEVAPTALVAFVANYQDLVWVLDEEQRELLLRLTPGAFDDDRGSWALCLAQAYALRGDAANVRIYAEEARKVFEEQLHATPNDAQRHVGLGLALAYLGRKEDAIREGERGVALDPVAKDAGGGPYDQHQLVRIFMLVSEPEKALDKLEPLLKIPYYLSPGWLKIDPNFDPLRKNPRFQKLMAGSR
jgi:tetratricopeptide (TPR) repeat protein